jgi:hypothetical protein
MECVLERLRVWWKHILAIKTFSARLIHNGEALNFEKYAYQYHIVTKVDYYNYQRNDNT